MRLLRLELRNYRGITAREVELARNGVTVIEGANEIGKSSMAEAIDILFEFRDDSAARAVRAIQPVGQDVATVVVAEIESGPYRFTYAKSFNKDRSTSLVVHSPEREQLGGREAHERVRAILAATLDQDLWKALRVQQGDALAQADLSGQRSLGAALDAAAQGELGTTRDAGLVDRVSAEYLEYFTPTGRRNAALEARKRAAAEADVALAAARDQLAALDADVDRHASLGGEIVELERRIAALATEAASAESAVARLAETQRAVEHLELTAKAADADRATAQAAADDRRRRAHNLASLSASLTALEASEAAKTERRAEAAAAARTSREGQERARARLRAAQELARVRRDDHAHLQDVALAQQLAESARALQEARDITAAARAALEDNAVDDDVLRRIERAQASVEAARNAFTDASASIEIEATEPVSVVDDDGGRTAVNRGRSHRQAVTAGIEVVTAGAILRVMPATSAQRLGDTLASAELELAVALRAGGVADYEEARGAFRTRTEAEHDLRAAAKSGAGDLERIEGQQRDIEARAATYVAGRPAIPALAPDLGTARDLSDEADREELAAQRAADHATELAEAAQRAYDELDKQSRAAVALINQARDQLALDGRELADARAASSDEDLESREFIHSVAATEARKAFEEAREALAELRPQELEAARDRSHQDLRAARDQLTGLRDERTGLEARVKVLGEQGLHDARAEAEAACEHARAEHEAWERRATAARLLHETLGRHRELARQAYLAPLRTRIEELGRAVFGPTFEVELTDDLRIARRTLAGLTLDFDLLSVGTREQLSVLVRVACATLVAPGDGGVPVILDDVLGFSDPERLARLGAVFKAAGECQVIVLTCVPDRYRSVDAARVIQLT